MTALCALLAASGSISIPTARAPYSFAAQIQYLPASGEAEILHPRKRSTSISTRSVDTQFTDSNYTDHIWSISRLSRQQQLTVNTALRKAKKTNKGSGGEKGGNGRKGEGKENEQERGEGR